LISKQPPTDWTVPRRVDKEKKNPVVDKDSLRGLAPDFNRGEADFERNTLKIVELNVFGNELLNFGTRGEVSAVQAFGFQGSEEVFHRSIVVGATRAGHGRRNMVFLSQVEVLLLRTSMGIPYSNGANWTGSSTMRHWSMHNSF